MGKFTIDAIDFKWINGEKDDPEDLCLHGPTVAYIGEHKFEYYATISATALYLLKTLTEDHIIYEENQMLPCCGFCYIANEALDNVDILGCCNGIDWTVLHDKENSDVIIILEDGTEERIPFNSYKDEVFRFADKIEAYYQSCTPKQIPDDEFEKSGYIAFWNEWHRRRGK